MKNKLMILALVAFVALCITGCDIEDLRNIQRYNNAQIDAGPTEAPVESYLPAEKVVEEITPDTVVYDVGTAPVPETTVAPSAAPYIYATTDCVTIKYFGSNLQPNTKFSLGNGSMPGSSGLTSDASGNLYYELGAWEGHGDSLSWSADAVDYSYGNRGVLPCPTS